jgi:hypothetical protein
LLVLAIGAILSLGRDVLMPITLAVLLSFVLAPARRHGIVDHQTRTCRKFCRYGVAGVPRAAPIWVSGRSCPSGVTC